MIFESVLLYKNLLESHRSYDKKRTYGRYSHTVETTSSSFDTRWGGRGRTFKLCYLNQKKALETLRFPRLFSYSVTQFLRGVLRNLLRSCATDGFLIRRVRVLN